MTCLECRHGYEVSVLKTCITFQRGLFGRSPTLSPYNEMGILYTEN